jgi:hypothetical protein
VTVELDEREVVDMDAALMEPNPEVEVGRGVRGTTVWLEVVDREDEDEDMEDAGDAGRGEI